VFECGVCGGGGPSGCDNTCGSTAVVDECGVCGSDADGTCDCDNNVDSGCGCGEPGPSGCDNECGSTAVEDECGVCGGGIADGACDCAGNVEDYCDVCGGDGWSCSPLGDVNQDYEVNIADIVVIVQHALQNTILEGNALSNADYNEDSVVNITDIVNIVQLILGDNLLKGDDPTYIDLSYNNNYISLKSDGKVAGLQSYQYILIVVPLLYHLI
jgi:hypothetical protein